MCTDELNVFSLTPLYEETTSDDSTNFNLSLESIIVNPTQSNNNSDEKLRFCIQQLTPVYLKNYTPIPVSPEKRILNYDDNIEIDCIPATNPNIKKYSKRKHQFCSSPDMFSGTPEESINKTLRYYDENEEHHCSKHFNIQYPVISESFINEFNFDGINDKEMELDEADDDDKTYCSQVEKEIAVEIDDNDKDTNLFELNYEIYKMNNNENNQISENNLTLKTELLTWATFEFENIDSNFHKNKYQHEYLAKIEMIYLKILHDLLGSRPIRLDIHHEHSQIYNCSIEQQSQYFLKQSQTKNSIYHILLVLHFLAEILNLLTNEDTCTIRELYYNDPEMAQSMQNVNYSMKNICTMLNAQSWDLGILSTSKGLIIGSMIIKFQDDTIIDITNLPDGILIPHFVTKIKTIETNAAFVLIVEKETVFRKLIQNNIFSHFSHKFLMITGKGFPDINTRFILRKLWNQYQLPMYALVDADPFGIDIMLIYRHGSMAKSCSVDHLAVPGVQWLGVYPSDIESLNLLSQPMCPADISRLNSLLKRSYLNDHNNIFCELKLMQCKQRKSEIESLSAKSQFYLIEYLSRRINEMYKVGI